MEDLQILFPDGHFESEQIIEEQQMVLIPLPKRTLDYYHKQATPSPDLYQFTAMREDGENAMHFYSNPNYFFEHWRLAMQRKAEEEARIEEEARMAEITVSTLNTAVHDLCMYVCMYVCTYVRTYMYMHSS